MFFGSVRLLIERLLYNLSLIIFVNRMTLCKHCGVKMPILPRIFLTSNDARMTGSYCSRKCISDRRASIPPFNDLRYLEKKTEKTVEEKIEAKIEKTEAIDESLKEQGLTLLFGV